MEQKSQEEKHLYCTQSKTQPSDIINMNSQEYIETKYENPPMHDMKSQEYT